MKKRTVRIDLGALLSGYDQALRRWYMYITITAPGVNFTDHQCTFNPLTAGVAYIGVFIFY